MNSIVLPNDIVFESVMDVLSQGESATLLLVGTSMTSFLKDKKDMVTLSPVSPDAALHKGDVVLFRTPVGYILHRIVLIDGDYYTMQGDNCLSKEKVLRCDIFAILTQITHTDGTIELPGDLSWRRRTRWSLARKSIRNLFLRCFNHHQRRWQSPLYFVLLAVLMWAPLNGIGISLDNFVFGLRLDHLLHASVFLLCPFFLADLLNKRPAPMLLVAWLIGVCTESVQYLLPWRGFDINDLAANFIGCLLGWLLVTPFLRRLQKKNTGLRQFAESSKK